MYRQDLYRQKQKEHFQNLPGENTNANVGLLAGVQLCGVTRSELLVKSRGCQLRHNDNVNHNISLSHHLLSRNMVP